MDMVVVGLVGAVIGGLLTIMITRAPRPMNRLRPARLGGVRGYGRTNRGRRQRWGDVEDALSDDSGGWSGDSGGGCGSGGCGGGGCGSG